METSIEELPTIKEDAADPEQPSSSSDDDLWKKYHTCVANDPCVGLINLEDDNGNKRSCCHYCLYVCLTPREAAEHSTRFGRRLLQEFGDEFENEARTPLFQYSGWNWVPSEDPDYFLLSPRYIDNDHVVWRFSDCSVCLSELSFVRIPPCCNSSICQICWLKYVRTTAENSLSVHITGTYNLHCYGCDAFVPYNAALSALDSEDLAYILPPGHTSFSVSRCPVCLTVPPPILAVNGENSSSEKQLSKLQRKKGGRSVTCDRCFTLFCALCGMTDHPDCSCKQLASNDHGYKKWAKQPSSANSEFRNSRRCPKCSIPLTLDGGCAQVKCPCGTEFCFTCGRRFLKTPLFDLSHSSNRLIPFVSCPRLWNSKPKRIAVHSLVGIGIIAAGVPIAPIVLPLLGTMAVVRKFRKNQARRRSATESSASLN